MPINPISVGAALTFTENETQFFTNENFSTPTIQASVTSLLNNNADRLELIFSNNGTVDVVIYWDSSVSVSNGIRLVANGGFIVFKIRDDFTLLTRPWFGISTGVAQAIAITEVVRITFSQMGGK